MAAVMEDYENPHGNSCPEEDSCRPQGPVLCCIRICCEEASVQHCSDDQSADRQVRVWLREFGRVRLDLDKQELTLPCLS